MALGLGVLYEIVDPLVAVATAYAFTRLIMFERITRHEVSRTSLPTLLEVENLSPPGSRPPWVPGRPRGRTGSRH